MSEISMEPQIIIIEDVWSSRNQPSKIVVKRPGGTDSFEYDDSSERRDQLINARKLAGDIVSKGRATGNSMRIDDRIDAPIPQLLKPPSAVNSPTLSLTPALKPYRRKP